MTAMALLGAGFGLGLLLVVRAVVPPRTDLAVAIGRWEADRRRASSRNVADHHRRRDRLGVRIADALARRGAELAQLRTDLAITGHRLESHLTHLVGTALLGLLAPNLIGFFATVMGVGMGYTLPLAAGIVAAVLLVALASAQLREQAEARRDELRRALGIYLDLVSMSLAAGRGVTEALPASAAIGTGWAFELIGDTIGRARRSGLTPWQTLGDLGREYGLQELTDLAASLTLVGDNGAKVRASLGARAATLRRRQLADARAQADQADDSMRITQIVLAFGFLVLIGYPAAMNILAI